MAKKKKSRISNIPLALSLFMILIFGVPTTLAISLYEYRAVMAQLAAEEAQFMNVLKERLRRDMEVGVDILDYRRGEAENHLKATIREVSDNIHSLMSCLYSNLHNDMSDDAIRRLIAAWLEGASFFQGRGYAFALPMDGEGPVVNGNRCGESEAGRGGDRQIAEKIRDTVREKGDGFIRYAWPLPDRPGTLADKISHVRRFRPFDWVVGVGDYPADFERRAQQEMIQTFRLFNKDKESRSFILDAQGHFLIGDKVRGDGFNLAEEPGMKRILSRVTAEAKKNKGAYALFPGEHPSAGETPWASALVYGRYYAPWDWTMGIVADLGPFHKFSLEKYDQLRKKTMKKYALLFGVMIVAAGFAVFMGKVFARRIKKNLSVFEQFLHKAGHSPEQIDLDQIPFDELDALGQYANAMVRKRVKSEETIRSVNEALRQANQRLEEMARMDGLTGVANRRFFDDTLAREWARAARDRRPVTIGMVDIDKFKKFNDTYGHQAGDDCLKQVACALKGEIKRPADLLARYGGEEFVLLMPETDLSGAGKLAADMKRAVALLEIPHAAGPAGRVSFSMGLACMVPVPGSSPDSLVRQADQALYHAKAKGRDRIEISPEASGG